MTDHGHPITFGVSLDPSADRLAETTRLARTAADGGFDLLAVQDHPYQPAHLDTWTMISHLAAETERIAFLTDVAGLPVRRAPTAPWLAFFDYLRRHPALLRDGVSAAHVAAQRARPLTGMVLYLLSGALAWFIGPVPGLVGIGIMIAYYGLTTPTGGSDPCGAGRVDAYPWAS